ncbi:MAG: hypothetical protein JSU66_17045 [Deltaproteobacteria bacterium]|nr:MAG: hypothetical protein JSU66_17045 [Deltaproteobacteria bacterium]
MTRLRLDLALLPVLVLAAVLAPRLRLPRAFRSLRRALDGIAQRRALAPVLVGLVCTAAAAILSLAPALPEPRVHDEFSYRLAADTYAGGRLANPPHPMWKHLEAFHVLQQPTYASKYFPAQGVFLAAGTVLAGHPIAGVWLATGLAAAAICWMFYAWFPPRWALRGALLAGATMVFSYWSTSYWGGSVAALGGALVYGALRRILRRPRVATAIALACGLCLLAASRPFEGLVASLPAAAVLGLWLAGERRPPLRLALTRIALPLLAALLVAGAAALAYNRAVTGDPLLTPYELYEETYNGPPSFIWQSPPPETAQRHAIFQAIYGGWAQRIYRLQQSPAGLLEMAALKLRTFWVFFLGVLLSIPLVTQWRLLTEDPWMRLAALTVALVLVANLVVTWVSTAHYRAPITALVFVLVTQALRRLRLWQRRTRGTGRVLAALIPLFSVCALASASVAKRYAERDGWHYQRARLLASLERDGARHLVIVRYGASHNAHQDWVSNRADVDGSAVVWARDMGPQRNAPLLEYFGDRRVWLLQPDPLPARLEPYPLARTP